MKKVEEYEEDTCNDKELDIIINVVANKVDDDVEDTCIDEETDIIVDAGTE